MDWRRVLGVSLVGAGLLLLPPTRFVIIRLLMLPAGLHWFFFLVLLVVALIAGYLYYRHRREQQRKERIRAMEEELGLAEGRQSEGFREVGRAAGAREYGTNRMLF